MHRLTPWLYPTPFLLGAPIPLQVTMLTEYAQGPNCIMHCLPSGSYDPQKHTSWEACARAELSEEVLACMVLDALEWGFLGGASLYLVF